MENTKDNDNPRALIQQPPEAVLTHLVGHIRDLRPRTVITFGPEGIYGHPDHIMTGKIAARAVELAADETWLPELYAPWQTSALYFTAAPRERMLEMADLPDNPIGEISEASRQNLGTPVDDITHWLDVSPWVHLKTTVLAAHRTQVSGMEITSDDVPESMMRMLQFEQYTRQPLPWDPDCSTQDALDQARSEIGSDTAPEGAHP